MNTTNKKSSVAPVCELCAPAGSIDCFHAAIDAGADAVYLGLADFNARLRAKNFTAKTLSHLVPLAHRQQVKVYVTLNTIVKQAELEPVIHALYQVDQIGVDAVIVADLGLIRIARQTFPRLRLHASTQMAVHNSPGVAAVGRLGCSRAVVARELTMEELSAIRASASIELELFVHGALCYGISGLCLASSFLGGASGNRGRCTQVCRRKFAASSGRGYYFSPRDLSLVDFVPRLRGLGIAALKIEGRMKNEAYVATVVNAYRKLLDGELSPDSARELLAGDLCRPKTTFYLGGSAQRGVIDATRSGVGRSMGRILEAAGDSIVLPAGIDAAANDRLRIDPLMGYEGTAAQVRSVSPHEKGTLVRLKSAVDCTEGEEVFLTARRESSREYPAHLPEQASTGEAVEPIPFRAYYPFAKKILADHDAPSPAAASGRSTLWIKTDSLDWLDLLTSTPCQRLVLACEPDAMEEILADAMRLRIWKSRLVPALPPFIAEGALHRWQSILDRFHASGIRQGMCSNIGHASLFGRRFDLFADAPLWCLNRGTQAALRESGFSRFTWSGEDDYLNIKAAASGNGIACLFSHVPLFISRIPPAVRPGREFADPQGNRFFTEEKNGLSWLLSKKPFCLTGRKDKLIALGIRNFLLDLSFCKADAARLSELLGCYASGTRLPGTGMVNFKAGLK